MNINTFNEKSTARASNARPLSQGIMGQHQIQLQDMPKLLIILSFVMEIYLGKKTQIQIAPARRVSE